MHQPITSKADILHIGRELIQKQGWTALNIRTLAAACGVSIGSIYNYYHSKSDLTAAIFENIWQEIFSLPDNSKIYNNFLDFVAWAFERIKQGDEKYPGFFTLHSMYFTDSDKAFGQQLMAQSWQHIKNQLYHVLINDACVRSDVFDSNFTQRQFTEILFSLILSALLQRNYDSSGILGMIQRVIY